MFIEKLCKEDFKNFSTTKLNLDLADIKNVDGGVYIRILLDKFGPSPEFVLQDFVCKEINNPISQKNELNVQKYWREFLVEKFGAEYKTACNDFLKKQYENNLLK